MGTYGVIREAVYKPAVIKHFEERSKENGRETSEKFMSSNFGHHQALPVDLCQDTQFVSVFDNPQIESFAVKSIKKSNKGINDEILNLIAIQQEIYRDRDDAYSSSVKRTPSSMAQNQGSCSFSGQNQYCVKLFDIFEDATSAHLVMELCQGDTLAQFMSKVLYTKSTAKNSNRNYFELEDDSQDSDSDSHCLED